MSAEPAKAADGAAGEARRPAATRRPGAQPPEIEQELYARRRKIYPRQVHGVFARLRLAGVLVLLGIYYLLPWVPWEGRQAVLFDLPARKFYIFDLVFWPQDFFYLALLLILAAYALFFFTTLAGRLWCGYACPQTVWTEVFMWIERKVEGDRMQRMKLDRAPWDARKIRIKAVKHALWALFALWTGFTFVGYFTPITELWDKALALSTGPWETFWILFYGFATWGNAGFLREQVCIYMCPYARFQSAMFDRDTLIISYDARRGEPRGPRRRGADPRELGLGDCIDCTLCVQVCPVGIDIRDGLQPQCIGCAACIDVCDEVMEKMGYPRGLIRYTTQNALEGRPTRILRPRVLVYGALLALFSGLLVWSVATRSPLGLDVIRDRNALYRETPEGLIENVYTLKILNKDERAHRIRIRAEGLEGVRVLTDPEIEAPPGRVTAVPARLQAPRASLPGRVATVRLVAEAVDAPGLRAEEEARFLGPGARR